MGCTVSEQPGTWGATRASAPRGVSAGASPAGLLRCLGRSVLTDAQCARKTTWEKMPRATKPRKRRMVPRKSVPAATKCPSRVTSQSVSTNRLYMCSISVFFSSDASDTTKYFHPVSQSVICLNLLWYNEGVCLRYSLPLPHCQKGFRVSGPARPFLRCISPRKHE